MASVFLSYDREDLPVARSLARALEKAGHSVWWDRRIAGGAQYSKAIEQALERAEAVVVLWSKRSIDSAWVRDEAAAGRDRNMLVPVTLDEAVPPMGFRQYQSIDLAGWKGGRRGPKLAELEHAIAALGDGGDPQPAPPVKPARRPAAHAIAVRLARPVRGGRRLFGVAAVRPRRGNALG